MTVQQEILLVLNLAFNNTIELAIILKNRNVFYGHVNEIDGIIIGLFNEETGEDETILISDIYKIIFQA